MGRRYEIYNNLEKNNYFFYREPKKFKFNKRFRTKTQTNYKFYYYFEKDKRIAKVKDKQKFGNLTSPNFYLFAIYDKQIEIKDFYELTVNVGKEKTNNMVRIKNFKVMFNQPTNPNSKDFKNYYDINKNETDITIEYIANMIKERLKIITIDTTTEFIKGDYKNKDQKIRVFVDRINREIERELANMNFKLVGKGIIEYTEDEEKVMIENLIDNIEKIMGGKE